MPEVRNTIVGRCALAVESKVVALIIILLLMRQYFFFHSRKENTHVKSPSRLELNCVFGLRSMLWHVYM